jgi:predicted transcriptional regulator YdeE
MTAKFEVIDFPATTLIGLEADFYGAMSPKFNGQEILGPLWGKVHHALSEIGIAFQGRMIAATRPSASGENGLLTQFVGQVVEHLPADLKGLSVHQLPAMRLATYEHQGEMDKLVSSIQKFYNEVLPNSGYEQPKPWSLELEIYDDRFSLENPESIMTIGSPVL